MASARRRTRALLPPLALLALLTTVLAVLESGASPAESAFPEANGKIAFHNDRDDVLGEVYVMNADGTGQTNLTNNAAGEGSAAKARPVRQVTEDLNGGYEIVADCIHKIGGFGVRQYTLFEPSGDSVKGTNVYAGVTQYNVCTDTFLITASGSLTIEDFVVSNDLGNGHVRLTGYLTNSVDNRLLPALIDLSFVPTSVPQHSNTQHPGHFMCEAAGETIPCNRTLQSRNGYFVGTFVVDGTNYVIPPGEGNVWGGAIWFDAVCVLPSGFSLSQCQLIELP